MAAGADQAGDESLVDDRSRLEARAEMAVPHRRPPTLQRSPLRFPFLQPAVEDGDIMGAEAAKHPPGAGGAVQRAVVVDDETLPVAKAERGHAAGELGLGR